MPRFRSLNVLYKHLDSLELLLGSPNEGQYEGLYGLTQASGGLVGADTILRASNPIAVKI